jgi:hypothetical protein
MVFAIASARATAGIVIGAEDVAHAVAKPNIIMIGNDVQGALFVTRELTISRSASDQLLAVKIGACKGDLGRRKPWVVKILLDGHKAFKAGDLILWGPIHSEENGQVTWGAAPATQRIRRTFSACTSLPSEKK